jgi:DNA-binding CsgD family transcriptional regulator
MRSQVATSEALQSASHILLSSKFPVGQLFGALDNFKVGIAILDGNLRYKAVSHALATMNGLAQEAHPGQPLHKVVGGLAHKIGSLFEQVLRTGQPQPNIQIAGQLPTRLQPSQWVEFYFPLASRRGRVVEVGAFVFELELNAATPQSPPDGAAIPSSREVPRGNGEIMPSAALNLSKFVRRRDDISLSWRERQVLELLAMGKSTRETSRLLSIAEKTVATYRYRLIRKLHATSLAQLIHYAVRNRMVDLS